MSHEAIRQSAREPNLCSSVFGVVFGVGPSSSGSVPEYRKKTRSDQHSGTPARKVKPLKPAERRAPEANGNGVEQDYLGRRFGARDVAARSSPGLFRSR